MKIQCAGTVKPTKIISTTFKQISIKVAQKEAKNLTADFVFTNFWVVQTVEEEMLSNPTTPVLV